MSADNWAICPQCLDRARAAHRALGDQAREYYGKVPAADYEALTRRSREALDVEQFRTFREDYEFWGAEEGKLHASYGGSCEVCGLAKQFEHHETFYEQPTA